MSALRTLLALLTCWLARLSSSRAGALLVYHRVGGESSGDPRLQILATISAREFARQVRHLRRHYRVVQAGELLDAAQRRRRGQRFPVSITFDDDLASHRHDAAPLLRSAKVTATFFLGGTSLSAPRPFWWEDLQYAIDQRLVTSLPHVAEDDLRAALGRTPKAIFRVAGAIERLDPAQRTELATALRTAVGSRNGEHGLRAGDVQALVGDGFEIGFHTLRHDALPALTDVALEAALRDGREDLAAAAGKTIDVLSYPYGKADERVAAAARAAGFTRGFVTGRRAAVAETDPLLIPRLPPAMSLGKTALRLARAVASAERR